MENHRSEQPETTEGLPQLPLPGNVAKLASSDFDVANYLSYVLQTLSEQSLAAKIDEAKDIVSYRIKKRLLSKESLILNNHTKYLEVGSKDMSSIQEALTEFESLLSPVETIEASTHVVRALLLKRQELTAHMKQAALQRKVHDLVLSLDKMLQDLDGVQTIMSPNSPCIGPLYLKRIDAIINEMNTIDDMSHCTELITRIEDLGTRLVDEIGHLIASLDMHNKAIMTSLLKMIWGYITRLRAYPFIVINTRSIFKSITNIHQMYLTISTVDIPSALSIQMDTIHAIKFAIFLNLLSANVIEKVPPVAKFLVESKIMTIESVSELIYEFIAMAFESYIFSDGSFMLSIPTSTSVAVHYHSFMQTFEILDQWSERLDFLLDDDAISLFTKIRQRWSSTFQSTLRTRLISKVINLSAKKTTDTYESHNYKLERIPVFPYTDLATDYLVDQDVPDEWIIGMAKVESQLIDTVQLNLEEGIRQLPIFRPRIVPGSIAASHHMASLLDDYYCIKPGILNQWIQTDPITLYDPLSRNLFESTKHAFGPVFMSSAGRCWMMNTNMQLFIRQLLTMFHQTTHYINKGILPAIQKAFDANVHKDRAVCLSLISSLMLWKHDVVTLNDNVLQLDSGVLWPRLKTMQFVNFVASPESNFVDALLPYWPDVQPVISSYIEGTITMINELIRSVEEVAVYAKTLSSAKTITTVLAFNRTDNKKPTVSHYVKELIQYYDDLTAKLVGKETNEQALKDLMATISTTLSHSLSDLLHSLLPQLIKRMGVVQNEAVTAQISLDLKTLKSFAERLREQLRGEYDRDEETWARILSLIHATQDNWV